MKLLLPFLILTTISYSQIIDKVEIDDFTKAKNITACAFEKDKISLKDNLSDSKDLSLYLHITYTLEKSGIERQALLLSFIFPKTTCIVQDSSKVMIMLNNDEIIESKSIGKTNCDKSITAAFIIEDLDPFTKDQIKKLRIYTSESYYDITLKENKKELVRKTFSLLQEKINQ